MSRRGGRRWRFDVNKQPQGGWSQGRRLTIPSSFSAAAAIGKGGANVKNVEDRTGARVHVEEDYIELTGPTHCVDAAIALYKEQFQAHRASGVAVTAYPHPHQAHIVLQGSLCKGCFFQSAAVGDEIAAATNCAETLYTLRGCGCPDAPDQLSATLSRLSLLPGAGIHFWSPSEETKMIQKMAASMLQALDFQPAFDRVKQRFNLGRQFYYNIKNGRPLRSRVPLNLQKLQVLEVGRDMRCVFSNAVPAGAFGELETFINENLGFRKLESRSTIKLHLVHQRDCTSAAVSFSRKPGGELKAHKPRSGLEKLFFLTFAHDSSQPDIRLKVTAHRTYSKDGDERARQILDWASQCQGSRGQISMPASQDSDFKVEKVRYSDEDSYEGRVKVPGGQGECAISLAIIRVREECGSNLSEHWEVTGACHEKIATCGAGDAGLSMHSREAQAVGHIQALLALCRRVSQHLGRGRIAGPASGTSL